MSEMSPMPRILFPRILTTVSKGMFTAPMKTETHVIRIVIAIRMISSPIVDIFPNSIRNTS